MTRCFITIMLLIRVEYYITFFWCDGRSQLEFQLFGDVLVSDATYKKNKYNCPLVVFLGLIIITRLLSLLLLLF